jgi:hypothetical protein
VHKLAVLGDWSLLTVTPLNPDGSHIVAYEENDEMYCDKEIIALMHRDNAGKWSIVQRDVGPCDYAWPYLFEEHPEYPAALLKYWEKMEMNY